MGEPVGSAHRPVGLRHGELEGGGDGGDLAVRVVLDVGDPALEEDLLPSFGREIEDVVVTSEEDEGLEVFITNTLWLWTLTVLLYLKHFLKCLNKI